MSCSCAVPGNAASTLADGEERGASDRGEPFSSSLLDMDDMPSPWQRLRSTSEAEWEARQRSRYLARGVRSSG